MKVRNEHTSDFCHGGKRISPGQVGEVNADNPSVKVALKAELLIENDKPAKPNLPPRPGKSQRRRPKRANTEE